MTFNFHRGWFLAGLLAGGISLLALPAPAVDAPPGGEATNDARGDLITASLLQMQEQLHNTQLAIQENQRVATDLARNNSDLMTARLQSLEQNLFTQREVEAGDTHRTQQLTLLLIGVTGLAALGILAWMVWLQSRAFNQLTRISTQQNTLFASLGAVPQITAPARAMVDQANARLLDAVSELKERVHGLEHKPGAPNGSLPGLSGPVKNGGANGHSAEHHEPSRPKPAALAEGQRLLDENAPREALEILDRYLATHPDDPEAWLKKADALQRVGRHDEALALYNRVIAADSTLAVAYLQKGGLLNRLRRYDEALNCYEQALQAQEKRRR